MDIIIGRNTKDGSWLLTVDGKGQTVSSQEHVPASIGGQHCRLTASKGQLRLRNLDVNNYTFVNGQSIESKAVTTADRIELGADRYPLSWELLKPLLPCDITPLRAVWDEYERQNLELQIKERKFNALRSATGLITMVAIVLSLANGGRSRWYFVLYGIAILTSLVFFIKAYRDSSKLPQRRQELARHFQRRYVCPNCGHYMGSQPYEILLQNGCCPYCKKQFVQ